MDPQPEMTADAVLMASIMIGGGVVGVVTFIGSIIKVREWITTPFARIEAQLAENKLTVQAEIKRLAGEISDLQIHFNPNGGDIASRVRALDARMTKLEASVDADRAAASNERSDLRLIARDVRDTLAELRDKDGRRE